MPGSYKQSQESGEITRQLWIYTAIVILLTAVSWCVYLRNTNDFQTRPLFGSDNKFGDLINYMQKTADLAHGAEFLGQGAPVYNYPAPAAFLYHVLMQSVPGHPVRPYMAIVVTAVLGLAFLGCSMIGGSQPVRRAGYAAILCTAFIGYPLIWGVYIGNLEAIVWAITASGVCCLLARRDLPGALLIGLATAFKPFPAIFLLLLLRRRKYKHAALAGALALLLVLMALTALGPSPLKAYQALKPGVSLYMNDFVSVLRPVDEMRFLHSPLDGMKALALIVEMHGFHPIGAADEVLRLRALPGGWHVTHTLAFVYPAVVLAGGVLMLIVFYRMPVLNQLIAMATAAALFPPEAAEYTLTQLYVPFGAFVIYLTREVSTGTAFVPRRSLFILACIFGLLFSPLTPFKIYEGSAKLLLLLSLIAVIAKTPMYSRIFDGDQRSIRGN